MIQRAYEAAQQAQWLDQNECRHRRRTHCRRGGTTGGNVRLTSAEHKTGTDRIAEVAVELDVEIVVNLQGDEPLVNPAMIDEVIQPLVDDSHLPMSTLCVPIFRRGSCTTLTSSRWSLTKRGCALFFRSLIPYPRKRDNFQALRASGALRLPQRFFAHLHCPAAEPAGDQRILEQLRVLEAGYQLKVVVSAHPYDGISVDTQEDLEKFAKLCRRGWGFDFVLAILDERLRRLNLLISHLSRLKRKTT